MTRRECDRLLRGPAAAAPAPAREQRTADSPAAAAVLQPTRRRRRHRHRPTSKRRTSIRNSFLTLVSRSVFQYQTWGVTIWRVFWKAARRPRRRVRSSSGSPQVSTLVYDALYIENSLREFTAIDVLSLGTGGGGGGYRGQQGHDGRGRRLGALFLQRVSS